MDKRKRNLVGEKIGQLAVISRDGYVLNSKGRHISTWKCLCDCGNTTVVNRSYLMQSNCPKCKQCQSEQRKNNHINDLIGKRFGRLTVIKLDSIKHRATYWLCKCDCGKEKVIERNSLVSGDIISCGCYWNEHKSEHGFKHGLTNSRLYYIWSGMKNRCNNPNAGNYNRYGGRGISICDEWKNSFENFYKWAMLNDYSQELTIDRIDTNGNYEPQNCRWVDRKTQQNNTRRNVYFTYKDTTHTIAEWSRILNVKRQTLDYRIKHNNLKDFKALSNIDINKKEQTV